MCFYSGDADGELISRLCGQAPPSVPLVIAAPQIWVHFRSDEHVEDRGFYASYRFEGKFYDKLFSLTVASPVNAASHADHIGMRSALEQAHSRVLVEFLFKLNTHYRLSFHTHCPLPSLCSLNCI